MKCRKTEMRSEMSRFVVLFTLTLHKFIILNGEWTIFVLPPSIFSGSFFFSGILPPEVKKMLCGDYGNNNDQENCLLKKMKIHVTLDLALASKKYKKRMLEGE